MVTRFAVAVIIVAALAGWGVVRRTCAFSLEPPARRTHRAPGRRSVPAQMFRGGARHRHDPSSDGGSTAIWPGRPTR